jgi:cysteine-rich repeat protein
MKLSTAALLTLASLVVIAGCTDTPKDEDPSDSKGDPIMQPQADSGADDMIATCDGAPLGSPCGKPGDRMHCIFDACVRNACGDGWPADAEACDDGNEIDGDGCSSRCHMEVPPGCGNGVLEPGEVCDDGNESNDDPCTASCTVAACGDHIVSRGEECDDGNKSNGDECNAHCLIPGRLCGNGALDDEEEECDDGNTMDGDECLGDCTLPPVCGDGDMDGDEECDDGNTAPGDSCTPICTLPQGNGGTSGTGAAGTGAAGTGAAGTGEAGTGEAGTGEAGTGEAGTGEAGTGAAGSGGVDESCIACRELNCTNYLEYINPLAGCFDVGATGAAARTAQGAPTFSMAQVQACVDAVSCAHVKHCGFELGRSTSQCYCGAAYPNNGDCASGAPGTQNGLCKAQIEAATGSTAPTTVMQRMASTDYPSGWVYTLLECEATYCDGGADGDCTP